MTRFLRFEIGGASALLWMLFFLTPYINIGPLIQIDAVKLFAVVFGSITLSIPLGNYLHQFTDSILNPFARRRLLFWPRAVISHVDALLQHDGDWYRDKTFQAILVFSKAHSRTKKISVVRGSKSNSGSTQENDSELNIEILREEISNRYSYYYARVENALVAPIFGGVFCVLVVHVFGATSYIHEAPVFSPLWIVLGAFLGAIPILWRVPHLFRELDDLEVALVNLQRENWPDPR